MQRRDFSALAALLAIAPLARAQSWPANPITWVIPFPPGGITDTSARAIGKRLSDLLGQQVLIDNRPGAGGSLGTEQVARAPADGYTWLYGTQGTMAANLALYKNLKYDPLKDFTHIHGMFVSPTILVVESVRPWKTVADLVREAKAKPGQLNYGSAGAGTGTHLTAELFQTESGTKLTHVPYKGTSPALQDMLGGRLDLMFDYVTPLLPHIQSGKLRALAVMHTERLELMPELPTIGQAGYPNAVSAAWSSIVVPAGTPPEVTKRIGDAVAAVLREKDVTSPFTSTGSKPLLDVRDKSLAQFVAAEQAKWAEVVRRSGATLG
ncbi:Bug family tripartite tricarboxylate transporter substrate binding protein [Aquabacterium sp.]|uniref:Bug family tripartite tricarboxylate transporter substrate binding protein n=1 Tax=Aquabacterium sp. TaxID=1872578 RepID=UPI003783E6D6